MFSDGSDLTCRESGVWGGEPRCFFLEARSARKLTFEAAEMSKRARLHLQPHPPERTLEQALEVLRQRGHRITEPRRALLEILIAEHGPFSAEDLHRRLGEAGGDPVTVYRGLATLEEAGLVRRCDFGDGVYRYEYSAGEHHHHHVICRGCGSVRTLEVCFAGELEEIAREMGYSDVTHSLEIFGWCSACQNARRGSEAPEAQRPAHKQKNRGR
jgi:Fe2+ or Zn2+ uptake regulation protein